MWYEHVRVLPQNAFNEPSTREGMTQWHPRQRKVSCTMFSFFSVYKAYSGREKPVPKRFVITGVSLSSVLFWLCSCRLLCSQLLTVASQQSCNSNPTSLLRKLSLATNWMCNITFTRSSLCLLAQSKIQVPLQSTKWSFLHACMFCNGRFLQ